MYRLILLPLLALLWGCAEDHDQNDPYIIENTEINYEAPAPYYDSDVGVD